MSLKVSGQVLFLSVCWFLPRSVTLTTRWLLQPSPWAVLELVGSEKLAELWPVEILSLLSSDSVSKLCVATYDREGYMR